MACLGAVAVGGGDIGREKLIDGRDDGVSSICCSGTLARVVLTPLAGPGSRPPVEGVGEMIFLMELSMLPERR